MDAQKRREEYWRKNLQMTGVLLFIWFVTTFVIGFFANDLTFTVMGWPFSFWVASQGSLIVYMLIIWYYSHTMNRMDTEFGVAEEEV